MSNTRIIMHAVEWTKSLRVVLCSDGTMWESLWRGSGSFANWSPWKDVTPHIPQPEKEKEKP